MFTVTVLLPGSEAHTRTHEVFDDRAAALDGIGWIAIQSPPGTRLVLRDAEGNDLMRLERSA